MTLTTMIMMLMILLHRNPSRTVLFPIQWISHRSNSNSSSLLVFPQSLFILQRITIPQGNHSSSRNRKP